MSITQARPQAATEDRLHSDLVKIWRALPPGPWTAQGADPDHELAREILAIRYPGATVKDLAAASIWIQHLVSCGFLTARKDADRPRLTVFTKAETAPEPDRRSFTEKEQAQLDDAAKRERQMLDEQARFARNLAEQWAALDPAIGQISSALRRLNVIDKSGVEQVTSAAVHAAIEPLSRQVAELSEQLAAAIEELGQLRSQTNEPRRFGRRGH
ncbi:hypothetical protein [Conexibacter sp. S30A1]|uniref:hypothetical protein n=1 Tax=Conexibacter sp. S30A1 TaxID=2937800 RepID=UPI002010171A|nr:hypothetical protein [Conexibacter sp. S30A1]